MADEADVVDADEGAFCGVGVAGVGIPKGSLPGLMVAMGSWAGSVAREANDESRLPLGLGGW